MPQETMFDRMNANIDSVLKALSGSNVELAEQMKLAAQMQEIKYFITSMAPAPLVKETSDTVVVDDENTPVDIKALSATERDKARDESDALGRAYNQWRDIKTTVASIINNPDNTLISISIPQERNLKITDKVNHTTSTMLMAASTNTKAYVLTKDSVGFYQLSAAEHWAIE